MRIVLLAACAALTASFVACDPAYEAPCRVVRDETPVSEPTISVRGNVALARTDDGFVASWVKIEGPDAGALLDADPAAAVDAAPSLAGVEVADLDARGALLKREFVASPPELRARKGSVEAAGIARENGATLLYWTDSVTTTDPDGRVRTAFALKGAYGDRVVLPPAAACEQCAMRIAVVAFADESIAIVRTAPDVVTSVAVLGAASASASPSFVAVRFRRDGAVSSEPLPWLHVPRVGAAPVGLATPPVDLDAKRDGLGRLVVTTGAHAFLVDRSSSSLRVLGGPVALPAPDAQALWGPAADDAAVAWSISASEDGRSAEQFTRREVFVANGAARERISYGRALLAADRADADVGFAFESAGRLFFAASSKTGRKRGGDVYVRALGDRGSEYGGYAPDEAFALAATSGGRFVLLALGRGALHTTEIVCAP